MSAISLGNLKLLKIQIVVIFMFPNIWHMELVDLKGRMPYIVVTLFTQQITRVTKTFQKFLHRFNSNEACRQN